jgi:hypothetical protein
MWKVLAEFHIGLRLRVTKPIFMKLALDRQPTEFHEHPTKCSGPGPRQTALTTGVLYCVKDAGKGKAKQARLSEVGKSLSQISQIVR